MPYSSLYPATIAYFYVLKSTALPICAHASCVQVVEGLDIVRQIEQSNTDRMDRPKSPVVISAAGEL